MFYINVFSFSAESNEESKCTENGAEDDVEEHLEEEFTVLEANAIVDPWAMMVHVEDASIACGAVVAAFGFEDVADEAEATTFLVGIVEEETPGYMIGGGYTNSKALCQGRSTWS